MGAHPESHGEALQLRRRPESGGDGRVGMPLPELRAFPKPGLQPQEHHGTVPRPWRWEGTEKKGKACISEALRRCASGFCRVLALGPGQPPPPLPASEALVSSCFSEPQTLHLQNGTHSDPLPRRRHVQHRAGAQGLEVEVGTEHKRQSTSGKQGRLERRKPGSHGAHGAWD